MKQLKVSAASFNSPMAGQWDLRSLQKLSVDFSQSSDQSQTVDQFLQHADKLYLKELKLTYTGPGFASVHAGTLAKMHVEDVQLKGFTICRSALLAKRKGRLIDCVLDISKLDLDIFYRSARELELERCRLSQTVSWRIYLSLILLSGLTLWITVNPPALAAVAVLVSIAAFVLNLIAMKGTHW